MALDRAVVTGDLGAGRLVNVLPEWCFAPFPITAFMPSLLHAAKTRAFLEFLTLELKSLGFQPVYNKKWNHCAPQSLIVLH